MIDRELQGRDANPTGGVLDSRTVKAPNAPCGGGYDAGKKPGFQVLPRRLMVERTVGWMTRWRRLVRDHEV
jgi:hypothetical protein